MDTPILTITSTSLEGFIGWLGRFSEFDDTILLNFKKDSIHTIICSEDKSCIKRSTTLFTDVFGSTVETVISNDVTPDIDILVGVFSTTKLKKILSFFKNGNATTIEFMCGEILLGSVKRTVCETIVLTNGSTVMTMKCSSPSGFTIPPTSVLDKVFDKGASAVVQIKSDSLDRIKQLIGLENSSKTAIKIKLDTKLRFTSNEFKCSEEYELVGEGNGNVVEKSQYIDIPIMKKSLIKIDKDSSFNVYIINDPKRIVFESNDNETSVVISSTI